MLKKIVDKILRNKGSVDIRDNELYEMAKYVQSCNEALSAIANISTDKIFQARDIARAQLRKYGS